VTSRDSQPPRSEDTALDEAVRATLAAGDVDGAVTKILRGLGPELLGFMVALTRSSGTAGDAFSELSVDIWKGLPKFEWRSTLRTWAYVLARRAVARTLRGGPHAPHIPLSQASVVSKVAVEVRDASLASIERMHDAFAHVRAQLDEDEQVILVLRVDRDMGWRDIARVLAEPEADEAEVDRVSATLRKRFERIKGRIRELTATK
jgi:RNA polymerase sigma-70 factor (ECF subfamily)